MERLIDGLGFEVVNVTSASARRIAQAYEQWGKGVHPAALNFGDCFAYEVAKEHGWKLTDGRMDYRISESDQIFGRYTQSGSTRVSPPKMPGLACGCGYSAVASDEVPPVPPILGRNMGRGTLRVSGSRTS